MTTYWISDPCSLFNSNNINPFVSDDKNFKFNSLTRLIIVVTLFSSLLFNSHWGYKRCECRVLPETALQKLFQGCVLGWIDLSGHTLRIGSQPGSCFIHRLEQRVRAGARPWASSPDATSTSQEFHQHHPDVFHHDRIPSRVRVDTVWLHQLLVQSHVFHQEPNKWHTELARKLRVSVG